MTVGWFFGALIASGAPKIKMVKAIPVTKKTTPQVNISIIIKPMINSLHHNDVGLTSIFSDT
jgi:hypothetical protein